MLTGCIMGVACLEFRGENFRGWLKNREIRESFLPRKFPAVRYIHNMNHKAPLIAINTPGFSPGKLRKEGWAWPGRGLCQYQ